jgi:hypothetical protein
MKTIYIIIALFLINIKVFSQITSSGFEVRYHPSGIGLQKYIGVLQNNTTGLELKTFAVESTDEFTFNISDTPALRFDVQKLQFTVQNKWNWFISSSNSYFSFYTGGRGISSDQPDMQIDSNGNISIGTYTTENKLTVGGNLNIKDKLLISSYGTIQPSNSNLEIVHANSINFTAEEIYGLQMKKGMNNDFTLFFPRNDNNGTRWNRILASDNFSFATGDRGLTTNESDLFVHSSGKIGINNTNPSEKLTLTDGNLKIENGKLFIGINANNVSTINKNTFTAFISNGILSEDFYMFPKSTWADHIFSNGFKLSNLKDVDDFIKKNQRLPDIPSASDVEEYGYSQHDLTVKLLQKIEELTLYTIERDKKIEQLKKVLNSCELLNEKVTQLEDKVK